VNIKFCTRLLHQPVSTITLMPVFYSSWFKAWFRWLPNPAITMKQSSNKREKAGEGESRADIIQETTNLHTKSRSRPWYSSLAANSCMQKPCCLELA
jgi:hypothetical protein